MPEKAIATGTLTYTGPPFTDGEVKVSAIITAGGLGATSTRRFRRQAVSLMISTHNQSYPPITHLHKQSLRLLRMSDIEITHA